jgi:hypothetical protein
MHALNAYFGGPKLDRARFESLIAEYDARQRAHGHDVPSARDFDSVGGDQRNIIAHILSRHGVFARIYHTRDRERAIAKAKVYGVAFVYTPDHVWLIKQDASPGCPQDASSGCPQDASSRHSWFKIDSLSGVTPFDIGELSRNSSLNMIVPTTELRDEFNEIASELNTLVMPDIVDYLIGTMKNKNVLGDAEILIGAAISILEMQNNGRPVAVLEELFAWYNQFTRDFTGSNCCSIRYVLRAVPQMIARILNVWRRTRAFCGD